MNHFENLWFYSFGYENATGGIIYAETKEEAQEKLNRAYGRQFTNITATIRPFNKHDATLDPDVKEVYSL